MQRAAFVIRRGGPSLILRRALASREATVPTRAQSAEFYISPELRRRNRITALFVGAFAIGVYITSIRKLKEDDFAEAEEELMVVNLHESGLKATKFKALLDSGKEEEEEAEAAGVAGDKKVVAEAAHDASSSSGEASADKPRMRGWKRWVLFWRKD